MSFQVSVFTLKEYVLCFLCLQVAHEDLKLLFSVLKIHRSLGTDIRMLFRQQSGDVITLAYTKTVQQNCTEFKQMGEVFLFLFLKLDYLF